MVGTRSATASGRYLASHIAYDLATNDVCVVSGLARGIDAWAHRGALRALESRLADRLANRPVGRPVGVVASGLDVVYPRENAQLWQDIATHGALISESAPGSPPEAFRFPLRNRILAALSGVLVVAGGVGANRSLRLELNQACEKAGVRVHYPELHLCTDNGAMIAMAAAMRVQSGTQQAELNYGFDVKPRWPLSNIDAVLI